LYPGQGIGDQIDGGDGTDVLNLTADSGDANELDSVKNVETINLTGTSYSIQVTDGSWFDTDATATTINASTLSGTLSFNGNDGGAHLADPGTPRDLGVSDDGLLSRAITVIGSAQNDTILTGIGGDSIVGGAGSDIIDSGDGNDTVNGASGNDSIVLGTGDDFLIVQSGELDGNDVTVAGGTGYDTIQLVNPVKSSPGTPVNITAVLADEVTGIQKVEIVDNENVYNNNTVTVTLDNGYSNLEPLLPYGPTRSVIAIDGSALDAGERLIVDTRGYSLNPHAVDGDVSITGGAGDDLFYMGHDLQSDDTIDGGAGIDRILVNSVTVDADFMHVSNVEQLELLDPGSAVLAGYAQAAGILSVFGSAGNDTVNASGYTVGLYVDGAAGNDIITTCSGDDTVYGGLGNDSITTNGGNDNVDGGDGNDTIITGDGNDTIIMGLGTDSVVAGNNDDYIKVSGFGAAAQLTESDTITGGDGNDTVSLQNQNDTVDASVDLGKVTSVENFKLEGNGYNASLSFTNGSVDTLTTINVNATALTNNGGNFDMTLKAGLSDSDFSFNIQGSATSDVLHKLNNGVPNNINFQGNGGDDTVQINGNDLGATVTINGGSGEDSIVVNGGTVNDDGFANVYSVERLAGTGLSVFNGSIGVSGEIDTRLVTLVAGTTYTMDYAGVDTDSGTLADPHFQLLGLDGAVIVDSDDDSGIGFNSRIVFTPTVTGTYTIKLGEFSYPGVDTGSYRFTVSPSVADVKPLVATLGVEADRAGIAVIDGTDGNDNVLLDPLFNNAVTVNVGGGNDTFNATASSSTVSFVADAGNINASDNLSGGTGTGDSFALVADNGTADLSNVTRVEHYTVIENANNNIGLSFTDNTFTGVANGRISIDAHTLSNGGNYLAGALTVNAGGVTGSRAFDITGGDANDNITTGAGNDDIGVGTGDNTVHAGAGNDSIHNIGGNNLIYGEAGNDTVTLGDGNNTVYGGDGNDTISVGTGNNSIVGGNGYDVITVAGNPVIQNNIITGGANADLITLGAGQDFLRIENAGDSTVADMDLDGIQDNDVLRNFTTHTDRIVVETQAVSAGIKATFDAAPVSAANAYNDANQVGVFFAGNRANFSDAQGAVSIHAGDGKADYVFEQDNHKLWIDVDDNGILNGLDIQITLDGVNTINAGDVVLRDTIAPIFPAEAATISEDRLASTTTPTTPLVGLLDAIDTDGGAVTYTNVVGGTLIGNTWTVVQTYGTLTLDRITGAYAYTANSAAIEALDDGEHGTDTFTITATDNVGLTVVGSYTVTVNGADDNPVLVAPAAASVTETRLSGTQTDVALTGTLVATDVDVEALHFGVQGGSYNGLTHEYTLVGGYGTLTVNELSGAYSYAKNVLAIEGLDDGETPTDTFVVTVSDGDDALITQNLVVTLNGADDQPVLAEVVAGSITELDLTPLTVVTNLSGTLAGTDVDVEPLTYGLTGGVASPFVNTLQDARTYGTLYVNTLTGLYAYTPNPAAVESIAVGETHTEVFTVSVSDGDDGTVDQNYTVTLTGANDAPVITIGAGDAAAGVIAESETPNLVVGDTLTVNDVDTSDTVVAAVTGVSLSGYTTGAPAGVGSMLSVVMPPTADTGEVNNLAWTFDSGAETFAYLDAGEDLILTYTVQVTDNHGISDTQTVTVTVQGTDQAPVITVAGTDSAASTLTETDASLAASGTLTVNDPDTTDTVDSAVTVVASDTTTGGPGGYGAMFTVAPPTGLAADAGDSNNLGWSFDSNPEAFNYLADDEHLTLTYTVTATEDDGGLTDTQDVVITINGTNDVPVLDASGTVDTDSVSLTETNAVITAIGSLTVVDLDLSDTVSIAVTSVNSTGSTGMLSNAALLAMMTPPAGALLADTGADGNVVWNFNSGAANAFDYLAAGETLSLVYTLTATDDSGSAATDTHDVTVTITGTNDVPVLDYVSSSCTPSTFTVHAFDPDNGAVLNLQTAVNGVSALNNGADTIFTVQSQPFVVVTDIVATDGTALSQPATPSPRLVVTQGTIGNDLINTAAPGYNSISYGFDGNDTITGGSGHDSLYGGTGADSLVGGAGNDHLEGCAGNDTLVGGAGEVDTFVFDVDAIGYVDTINDYESIYSGASVDDILDLTAYGLTYYTGPAPAMIAEGGAVTASSYTIYHDTVADIAYLFADVNGDGQYNLANDLEIVIVGAGDGGGLSLAAILI